MQVLANVKKMIAGSYKRKVYNCPSEWDGATTKGTKRAKIVSGLRAYEVNVFFEASRSLNNGNDEPLRGKARHEIVSPHETFAHAEPWCRLICFSEKRFLATADGADGAENEGLKRLNQGFATEMLTGEERGG